MQSKHSRTSWHLVTSTLAAILAACSAPSPAVRAALDAPVARQASDGSLSTAPSAASPLPTPTALAPQDPAQDGSAEQAAAEFKRSGSVSLGGSYTTTPQDNGTNSSTVSGQVRLGFYLSQYFEVGVGYGGSATDPRGEGFSIGSSTTGVDAKVHMNPMQRLDPYLGVRAGFTATYISTTGGYDTNGSFGGVAGCNANMNESTAFYIEYAVDTTQTDSGTSTTGGIYLGLTYFF